MEAGVVIVDDEKDARDTLKLLLDTHFPDVNVLADVGDVDSAVQAIESYKPDLLFLDVRLKKGSGFDVLEKIPHPNFDVVFTTAYEEYALQAIKFSALDYLLKPVNHIDLLAAIRKFTGNARNESQEKLKTFRHNRLQPDNPKLVLTSSDGFRVSKMGDISRCMSEGHYTWVYFTDGSKFLSTRILKDFDEMLSAYGFFRCHQSHLINLDHIRGYKSGKNARIEMCDSTRLELSKHRKKAFLDLFLRNQNPGES